MNQPIYVLSLILFLVFSVEEEQEQWDYWRIQKHFHGDHSQFILDFDHRKDDGFVLVGFDEGLYLFDDDLVKPDGRTDTYEYNLNPLMVVRLKDTGECVSKSLFYVDCTKYYEYDDISLSIGRFFKENRIFSLKIVEDGNILIIGWYCSSHNFIAKLDDNLELIWAKHLATGLGSHFEFSKITVTSDGGYIFANVINAFKFSKDGEVDFVFGFNKIDGCIFVDGLSCCYVYIYDIAEVNDGFVFVGGATTRNSLESCPETPWGTVDSALIGKISKNAEELTYLKIIKFCESAIFKSLIEMSVNGESMLVVYGQTAIYCFGDDNTPTLFLINPDTGSVVKFKAVYAEGGTASHIERTKESGELSFLITGKLRYFGTTLIGGETTVWLFSKIILNEDSLEFELDFFPYYHYELKQLGSKLVFKQLERSDGLTVYASLHNSVIDTIDENGINCVTPSNGTSRVFEPAYNHVVNETSVLANFSITKEGQNFSFFSPINYYYYYNFGEDISDRFTYWDDFSGKNEGRGDFCEGLYWPDYCIPIEDELDENDDDDDPGNVRFPIELVNTFITIGIILVCICCCGTTIVLCYFGGSFVLKRIFRKKNTVTPA